MSLDEVARRCYSTEELQELETNLDDEEELAVLSLHLQKCDGCRSRAVTLPRPAVMDLVG
jgi:hypothetical protein